MRSPRAFDRDVLLSGISVTSYMYLKLAPHLSQNLSISDPIRKLWSSRINIVLYRTVLA
jgi:hypothetical protein